MARFKQAITDTNRLLSELLDIVRPDFLEVTRLLKAIPLDQATGSSVAVDAYQHIIQELQYHDVLTQKIQHIIAIHTLILPNAGKLDDEKKWSQSRLNVVRLNHIQFQVACFEYLSSVNYIQNALNTPGLCQQSGLDVVPVIFGHSTLFLTTSRSINSNFSKLSRLAEGSEWLDLQSNLTQVEMLYSMESERDVLHAYISKPMISDSEIEPLYGPGKDNEIDLF